MLPWLLCPCACCRSSHEERGLKFIYRAQNCRMSSRSSHEERGLKYVAMVGKEQHVRSLLA